MYSVMSSHVVPVFSVQVELESGTMERKRRGAMVVTRLAALARRHTNLLVRLRQRARLRQK